MIDRDRLAQMMDGDYAVADKLIRSFKLQIEQQIPALDTHLAQQDFALLENTAHIVKTQAGYMGLDDIVATAQALENAASNGSSAIPVIEKETRQLQIMLGEFLQSL